MSITQIQKGCTRPIYDPGNGSTSYIDIARELPDFESLTPTNDLYPHITESEAAGKLCEKVESKIPPVKVHKGPKAGS